MISDQDVARYRRDGYIVVPDVLSAEDIAVFTALSPRTIEAVVAGAPLFKLILAEIQ